jgi:hypothetical protein
MTTLSGPFLVSRTGDEGFWVFKTHERNESKGWLAG